MEINTRQAGRALIVRLEGELDAYWAGETERELWSHMDRGSHWLVLDLASLSYLSSGGLRSLLRTHRRLVELGGKLALAAPRPYVRDVLAISGVAQALAVHATVPEALEAMGVAAPQPADAWSGAQVYDTPTGAYRLLPCGDGSAQLTVVGDAGDLLHSRATADRLTSVSLARLGYGLAVGAPGESAAAALGRLGEVLIQPGSIFWQPGDGRQAPDFLTADLGGSQVAVHLLSGLWLQGPPQFTGRFAASGGTAGTSLEDWARGLCAWAARAAPAASRPVALGVALRGELAEMWGVGLKRAPLAGQAPANGQGIAHRENLAEWLHYPTEPAFANYTLLAAGLLVSGAMPSVGDMALPALFGPQTAEASFRLHLHGAAFHPVPELGGGSLDDELRHVSTQGELAGVAHLLPTTRLRSVLFGAWLLGA